MVLHPRLHNLILLFSNYHQEVTTLYKNPFCVSWHLAKHLSEDLRFVVQAGLISHVTQGDLLQQPSKQRPHWFRISWQRTKRLSEGLRFVVWPGLIYKTKTPLILRQLTTNKGRRGGLMVSALDSGASGLGSSPGRGHCVVFLGKTLYSHSASLHSGV